MNPNAIMHTTTKKKLRSEHEGRSRWPFVRVFASLCPRRIARPFAHARARVWWSACGACVCARTRVRAYLWDKELCKHEFTSGEHYCPGPGASYPSGTSLVQSFLLVTLPVTSTSMRYDRYDTCLYVRAPLGTRANAPRIGRADGWRGTSGFRREATRVVLPRGELFFLRKRATRQIARRARSGSRVQNVRALRRTCQRVLLPFTSHASKLAVMCT